VIARLTALPAVDRASPVGVGAPLRQRLHGTTVASRVATPTDWTGPHGGNDRVRFVTPARVIHTGDGAVQPRWTGPGGGGGTVPPGPARRMANLPRRGDMQAQPERGVTLKCCQYAVFTPYDRVRHDQPRRWTANPTKAQTRRYGQAPGGGGTRPPRDPRHRRRATPPAAGDDGTTGGLASHVAFDRTPGTTGRRASTPAEIRGAATTVHTGRCACSLDARRAVRRHRLAGVRRLRQGLTLAERRSPDRAGRPAARRGAVQAEGTRLSLSVGPPPVALPGLKVAECEGLLRSPTRSGRHVPG
jgi:hypothetical protein